MHGWGKPDLRLAREICGYGLRGQMGGMFSLINLRLDVAILGALVGPGTLGVYAVASKYAECSGCRAGHHLRALPAPGRA